MEEGRDATHTVKVVKRDIKIVRELASVGGLISFVQSAQVLGRNQD